MKYQFIHIIIQCVVYLTAAFSSFHTVRGEGIRIIPRSVTFSNDSLHFLLEMDLNAVRVNTLTAVSFTPLLKGTGEIALPPVVVTGNKRYRFERRERALAVGKTLPVPYMILKDNHETGSKIVRYHVSIPYASWMGQAALLLRQEIKDCCDLQLLAVDTLTRNISVDAPVRNPVATSAPVKEPVAEKATPAVENYSLKVMIQNISAVSDKEKTHVARTTLYIDYPVGKDEVLPDYKNNRKEIDKVDSLLVPLLAKHEYQIRRVRVRGYASPDGSYRNNERLAANRSRLFSGYIRDAYGLPERLFDVSSVAEDWTGLIELLNQEQPFYCRQALDIINRYGIFSGREKQLMEFQGGVPYRDMLKNLFPKLRRIEVVVEYDNVTE